MSRYRFIAGCPVCGDQKLIRWQHTECSSEEEIDENGDIHCLKCKKNLGFIADIKFKCDNHDSKEVTDEQKVIRALSMLADKIPRDSMKKIIFKLLDR